MKITLGQINTTPGDFEGNLAQIKAGVQKAAADKSNVIVFPELAVCGYLSKDWLSEKSYLEKNYDAVTEINELSRQYPDLTILVGFAGFNTQGSGKLATNSAAVICNGRTIGIYNKQLLCFYDIFDEWRYFEPDTDCCIIEIAGRRCGVVICEDVWHSHGEEIHLYGRDPIEKYRELGVEGLLILNSSPFHLGKFEQRNRILSRLTTPDEKSKIAWAAYCNQYGGQDELVFDGRSCVYKDGRPLAEAGFGVVYPTVDLTHEEASLCNLSEMEALHKMLCLGLREYVSKTGFTDVVLGSSGGIDSALVATLASQALGPEHVHCIRMPSKWSTSGSLDHSAELHHNLGCEEYTVPIEHMVLMEHLDETLQLTDDPDYNEVARENIQARLRAIAVMHMSNAKGYLPLTTGNKTEIALGYCTVNGDMVGGYNPIGDLYKGQVYELARWINKDNIEFIPQEIIDKAPSAELAPNQTDESSLQLSYELLDAIAHAYVEDRISTYKAFQEWGDSRDLPPVTEKEFNRIINRIDLMEFKRYQAAPIIKISAQAFGTGRRMPIATNKSMRRS